MKANKDKLKPVNSKIPRHASNRSNNVGYKNKINYMQHNKSGLRNYRQKYEKDSDFGSSSNRYEASKIQSVNGDESESVRLEAEKFDISDSVSQFSAMQVESRTIENMGHMKNHHQNSFSGVKSEINSGSKLTEKLDLSDQSLLEVPMQLCFNMKLQSLKLSNNKLTHIPSKLCDLLFLKSLYLDNNMLKSLPKNIGKLSNLKCIDFNNNQIDEIPKEIGSCLGLKKIGAKNNCFTAIPASLGKLENLLIFDIEWFKYCLPPIRIKPPTDPKSKENLTQIMNKFRELCTIFMDYGELTLTVFLNYFSSDVNVKNKEVPDYNKQDNRKRTILHRAAATGHIGVVKGLLNINSIDPNKLEKDQCTPLGLALRDDKEEVAHILLEKDSVDVNEGNGSFGAPLHIAVSKNKVDIIKKLIQKNVDVNKLDFKRQTPLHIIMDVFSRDIVLAEEITRLLVFNGAKPNLLDSEKLSPLHRAVIKKHLDGIKLICKLNNELKRRSKEVFDLNLVGGEKKYTPIYYALEKKANDIAEFLFTKHAKVCIRLDFEYLPREWKKRESNSRRHILWKMEKYEVNSMTNRIVFKEEEFNSPSMVKRIEGQNNCIDDYSSVGSYLKKLHSHKLRMLKKRKANHKHHISQNSTQKILFTINNPKTKEGDAEVEDIHIDSENDVGEDRDGMNSSYISYNKKSMVDLNDDAKACLIPKSLSVNNNDHSKGPNIFLLRDMIIDQKDPSLQSQLEAVNILANTKIEDRNRVNYNSVLRDLSNNLHTITHQTVLVKTIELLQYKGSDVLVDNLNSYIDHTSTNHKVPVAEVFKGYDPTDLMSRPYTQIVLKTCVNILKEEGLLFQASAERRPYFRFDTKSSRNDKFQARSVNRILHNTGLESSRKPSKKINKLGMTIKKVAAVPKMIDLISNDSDRSTERKLPQTSHRYKLPPGLTSLKNKAKPSPGTVQEPLLKYMNKNIPK